MRKFKSLILAVLLLFSTLGCVLSVPTASVVNFDAIPQTINPGESSILVWLISDAENAVIEPGLGSVPLAGSRQVNPSNTTTYTMTATGRSGTTTRSVTVVVNPRVIINSFTPNPTSINQGGSSTLQWDISGATSVNIDQRIGSVTLSGSRVVTPSNTTTYTLTATRGPQVASASSTVTVVAPPVVALFTASPQQISLGATSRLSWEVTGASRIRIDPNIGTVPAYGSVAVRPSTTTSYILTAESDCCVINRAVTVGVDQLLPPSFLPIVHVFNITPSSIYRGNSAILSWQVSGANRVVINQGIGEVAPSGVRTVSPQNSTVFTLTAYNQHGYRTVSVSVVVFEP